MKILQLTKKDRELFLDMDPLFMMERMELPGAFALAAVLEQEKTGEEIPAGVVVCHDTGSRIVILWLCVAAGYRRQGIGEHLLKAVYDLAVQLDYATVGAYLNTEYGRDMVCAGEETYLRDRLFGEIRPLAGEWATDISTLMHSPLLKVRSEKTNVIPLRTLSSGDRQTQLQLLSEEKYAAGLYPIEDKLRYLDQDISCLLYEDGVLTGGLLVQSMERITTGLQGENILNATENVLYPVFVSIRSPQGIRSLLAAVLARAAEKYPADSEVRIVMNKGLYAPLMERILPDSRIESKILVASVEDYKRQDEELELQMLLSLG